MKNPSAIIFDLDGTLVDSSRAIVECINYALAARGLPKAPDDEITKNIGMPLEEMFSPFSRIDLAGLVRLYREHYRRVFLEKTFLLPGVMEALEMAAGRRYRLAVATTKPAYFARPILENLGVWSFFDTLAGGEEVARLKPSPDLLNLALERLCLGNDETLYVGDHPVDVEAAAAAGIAIVCVATGFWSRGELETLGPAAVIDRLPDLLPLLDDAGDDAANAAG